METPRHRIRHNIKKGIKKKKEFYEHINDKNKGEKLCMLSDREGKQLKNDITLQRRLIFFSP